MREDMYKVIVERPRRGKYGYDTAARRRNDFEGSASLGMRAGYGYRALNENLAPLRRYLRAQVGRPWNKVFSEICAGIDGRNSMQQHIRQHIDDFIATKVEVRDGNSSTWSRDTASGQTTARCAKSFTSIRDRASSGSTSTTAPGAMDRLKRRNECRRKSPLAVVRSTKTRSCIVSTVSGFK